MGRVAIIPAALVPIPALLSAQVVGDAAPGLEGCYRLELGDWEPSVRTSDAHFYRPPGYFRLTDVPIEVSRREASMVQPVIPHSSGSRAWWEQLDGDSVQIMWNDGYTHVQLDLEAEGDSLVGSARATSDLRGMVATIDAAGDTILKPVPIPAATALARPVLCPEWLQRLPEPAERLDR